MIQIINNKRYNTETAKEIADFWNGYDKNNWKYCWETLFRTKKGTWFIYGKGGPATKYMVQRGQYSYSGEKIIVLTDDEVIKWLEENNHDDLIEEYFPNDIEEA